MSATRLCALSIILFSPLLALSGCALSDGIFNDPEDEPGFDLSEADMTGDMQVEPDQDMAPDLDMDLPPDMDMDMPADMPDMPDMDMAPDMDMPTCQDYAPATPSAKATAVAVGQDFSCALLQDQTVQCWGDNRYGQLGTTIAGNRVRGLCEPVISIGAGSYHACAVLASRKVSCWGLANLGQLGDGRKNSDNNSNIKSPVSARAVAASNIVNAKRVYGGEYYTCAQLTDDNVACWGRNNHKQINGGGGVVLPVPTLIQPPGGVTASQLSTGENNTCMLGSDGQVYCWGRNEYGESGEASPNPDAPVLAPNAIMPLTNSARVTAGSGLSCAIAQDSDASGAGTNMTATLCWGGLDLLKGRTVVTEATPTPTRQHVMPSAQELYVGKNFACVLNSDGSAECWGVNEVYQLGDGALSPATSPVRVKLPEGVLIDSTDDTKMDIDAQGTHACAVSADGDVYCWGNNDAGQLGAQPALDNRPRPVKVQGL